MSPPSAAPPWEAQNALLANIWRTEALIPQGKISEPYSGGRKHASSHPAGKSTEKLALGESFAESPNNEKEREGSKKK